jgi:chitinase
MRNAAARFSFALVFAIIFFAACRKATVSPPALVIAPPPSFGFYVIGYFPSYRDPNAIPDIKFRMCSVVNYAFATVNTSGGITINSPSVLSAVVTKAKANGAKVFISVNGSTTDFKNMASTPSGRTTCITQIMNVVRQHQLQGVDVDWEFPSTADGSDALYTSLMKELSDSCHLDSKYYCTAAVTSGKYAGSYRDAIKTEVFSYLDWFNIMAYDDFTTTAPYKQHSDYSLTVTALNYWVGTRGMPKQKAVLGIPVYGRPSGITQTGTVLTYSGILGQGGSPLADSAIVTAAGFTNYKIYYNGQPTVKNKTMLAKTMGNGIMIWEKTQDTNDNTSLLKAACDTIGRPY